MLLAFVRQRNDVGPHGQPMSEANDPRANPAVDGGWHYEAPEAGSVDYAQLAINEKRDAYFKIWGDRLTDAQKQALHWSVKRVDDLPLE